MVLGTPTQETTPGGLPPPWEAKQVIQQVRAQVSRVSAALGQLPVAEWQGTGAANYVAVAESARRQMAGIGGALDRLANQPERLNASIHLFLALQHVESNLDTLAKGAAQFQGPEAARELEDATNDLLNQRERLIKYILELVQFLESTSTATQRELESCRSQLWKRAPELAPQRRQ